jgi:hypothetical protein
MWASPKHEGDREVNKDELRAPIKKDEINTADKTKSGRFRYRLNDLNREMLRLPVEERRNRWREYYERLKQVSESRNQADPNTK